MISNLKSRDRSLVLLSGWAIGKMGAVQADPVPPRLNALRKHHWSPVELSEIGGERINIRPDIVESLHTVLPPTDDKEYEDFRRVFFHHVFHPENLAKKEWIAEVTEHPWYLKLQRARFPHPRNRQEAEERFAAIREAQGKLVNRLFRNPTLGLRPEEYRLLPGFLKRHTQSIAWSIQRSKQRAARRVSSANVLHFATSDSAQADIETADFFAALQQFLDTELPEEEALVFRLRRYCGWTVAQVAAGTRLSESQVKTRMKRAEGALNLWVKDHV